MIAKPAIQSASVAKGVDYCYSERCVGFNAKRCLKEVVAKIIRFYQGRDFGICALQQGRSAWSNLVGLVGKS